MNKKGKNRIAAIIVILLGSMAFWLIINNKKGTIKETLRDFAVEDTASITKIFLADKSLKSIILERKPGGTWMVNGKYIARADVMQTLMQTIKNVDVKEPVGNAAQDNIIKRLSGSAIKCEIYAGEELVKAYYVGTETADQKGTYMILIDPSTMKPSAKAFVTYIPGFEGYLTTRYLTKEKGWRDQTIFKYNPDQIKSVRLEAPNTPEFGYEVMVNGNNNYDLQLLNKQKSTVKPDTLAVKQYLTYFRNLSFETFEDQLSEKQLDSLRMTKPLNIMTVKDNTGKTTTVKFYPRYAKKHSDDTAEKKTAIDMDRMDATIDDGKEVYVVQYYVFGKVMPPADYFQRKGGINTKGF
ncbi:MAG TPA: hypothetical protein VFF27_08455 [Bacteroidia bacterium]|jgi:hypothetical protein|nr:hypothetical protein [Bacteroidia bacterium]